MTKNEHLSRTYGRANSVTRFAGAPIEMTAAAFAMKNALYPVISSEWQSEKFPVREEVVHSKPSSSPSGLELLRSGRVVPVAMTVLRRQSVKNNIVQI